MQEFFRCPRKQHGIQALLLALILFCIWGWCEAHPSPALDQATFRQVMFSLFILPLALCSAWLLLTKPQPDKPYESQGNTE